MNSHEFPTTGALMYALSGGDINEDNASSWCSGTLIGCSTFLTAAHCAEDDADPAHYWVFLQHTGVRQVTSITTHPDYTSPEFPEFDLAVLKLGAPVTGIDPTEINTVMSPPAGNGGDYGIKRAGQVITSSCAGVLGGGLGDTELVCWAFANPVGLPGDDSNTCNGDSGGPLFVDLGGSQVVAGVTSGGSSGDCLATDDSYDSNVFTYRSFVLGELGADSTSSCGGLAPVGDPTTNVTGFDGNLGSGNTSDALVVNVAGTPSELRVVLKGEDNGSLNVDFFVKQGLGAGVSTFDCKSDGAANVAECVFAAPAAGDWSVFVQRASGAGEYQVTATVFGGDPPVCGNGRRETGEECDGSDDAACRGLCEMGCVCPAPVCGNSLIESGEQCDGTDPGACLTGTCGINCSCPAPACGNNVTESGEQCDGPDDGACPSQCDTGCTCAATCNTDDLLVAKLSSSEKRLSFRAYLVNDAGIYDGLDPRNQFRLTLAQGTSSVTIDIPTLDTAWNRSKPSKGRYLWKGDLGGVRRITALDRSAKKGTWKLKVKGKAVPGAVNIDLGDPTLIDVQLSMDGVCSKVTF